MRPVFGSMTTSAPDGAALPLARVALICAARACSASFWTLPSMLVTRVSPSTAGVSVGVPAA